MICPYCLLLAICPVCVALSDIDLSAPSGDNPPDQSPEQQAPGADEAAS
jgi:hypothetical protein